ncbi:MAG: hypothetical protein NTY19_47205 [Planctomycetota bacterium]|nr:hypothetical protein [Planctomycetota bacterium]
MTVRLYLIAGATGSGKSTLIREGKLPIDALVFDYDQLMRDALPRTFPYFAGDDEWDKTIWESTKGMIRAKDAMLAAVREDAKYSQHVGQAFKKAICHGYQLSNRHWVDTMTSIVHELTGAMPTVRICWLHPPLAKVIANRKNRKHGHDSIPDSKMQENYDSFAAGMGHHDVRVDTTEQLLADANHFLNDATEP